MASLEGESVRVLEKFNGTNFNLWKFKMNLALSSMDLWRLLKAPRRLHHLMQVRGRRRTTKGG